AAARRRRAGGGRRYRRAGRPADLAVRTRDAGGADAEVPTGVGREAETAVETGRRPAWIRQRGGGRRAVRAAARRAGRRERAGRTRRARNRPARGERVRRAGSALPHTVEGRIGA